MEWFEYSGISKTFWLGYLSYYPLPRIALYGTNVRYNVYNKTDPTCYLFCYDIIWCQVVSFYFTVRSIPESQVTVAIV